MEHEEKQLGFFDLLSSLKGEARDRLQNQFEIFQKRISLAYKYFIENPDPLESADVFRDYHTNVFDEEFQEIFGLTGTIIIYLYESENLKEFESIFIPTEWEHKKKRFMEEAIKDLQNYFIEGKDTGREHLFLEIQNRLKFKIENPDFHSYSTFIRDLKPGATDETGRILPIGSDAEDAFKEEMFIVTPLYYEVGTFLVTVNTFIRKGDSLFTSVDSKDQFDALKKWYINVHESLSECLLPAVHLLRLREEKITQEIAERVSALTYLLGHTFSKSFTTPVRNSLERIQKNHEIIRSLPNMNEDILIRLRDSDSIIQNVGMITDNFASSLSVLDRFGQERQAYEAYRLETVDLSKIREELEIYSRIFFNKRKESILRDSFLASEERERIRTSNFEDWIKLRIYESESSHRIRAHKALLLQHLINFLNNCIQHLNYHKIWRKGINGNEGYKGEISFSALTKQHGDRKDVVIEIKDNGEGIDEEMCERINNLFKEANQGNLHLFSSDIQRRIRERFYTRGHGGSKGLSMILSADYFSRIRCQDSFSQPIRGNLSVESYPGRGTTIRITVPVSINDQEKEIYFL